MTKIENCKVAVFGGAGFLGSHLVENLVTQRGCHVQVFDNLCSGRLEFVDKYTNDIHTYNLVDPYDKSKWIKALQDFQPEYVFNYAAMPYIPDCYSKPIDVFKINAMFPMELIEQCDLLRIPLLQVSSAEVYGSVVQGFIDESIPPQPKSTYGVSKLAIDQYIQNAWLERGSKAIALRQFNCIGARETHPYVVPEIMTQLSKQLAHRRIDFFLGNNSIRDFMPAATAVECAIRLLETKRYGEIFNCGMGTHWSINDLATLIVETIAGDREVVFHKDPKKIRVNEIWYLLANNNKLLEAIDCPSPPSSVLAGIEACWNWYKQNGFVWPWEQKGGK